MRGSLAGLQQCSSRCQKEAKTMERLLKWRKVLMEDGNENGSEGDIEEDKRERGAANRGAASRNCRRFKGVDVVLSNIAESQSLVPLKEVGIMGPSKRPTSQGISGGTLKIGSYHQ